MVLIFIFIAWTLISVVANRYMGYNYFEAVERIVAPIQLASLTATTPPMDFGQTQALPRITENFPWPLR